MVSPRTQKTTTDFFALYRDGQAHHFDLDKSTANAWNWSFPLPGRWAGHQRRAQAPWRYPINKVDRSLGPSGNGKEARAVRRARSLETILQPASMKFVRILGWGGMGVACLFEGIKAGGKGDTFRVVCKASLKKEHVPLLKKERMNHVHMAGAMHIVQRVLLQDPPPESGEEQVKGKGKAKQGGAGTQPGCLTLARTRQAAHNALESRKKYDAEMSVLFLEYMRRGSMIEVLEKVGAADEKFPGHVLWHIFHCLFKACVAMAFPDTWNRASSLTKANVPQISEVPKPNAVMDAYTRVLVHFDIDAQNILLGDLDTGEHKNVPVIKVADLGLARIVNWLHRDDISEAWYMRRVGKDYAYTPEQFTEEWDYTDGPADFRLHPNETAGHYHWWTNLYQIGLIMFQLITLHYPETPPTAEYYQVRHRDGKISDGWSYGTWLLDPRFDHIDMDLRRLVVMCLSHTPTVRPTMEKITEVFSDHIPNDSDHDLQKLVLDIFGDPPPPVSVPLPVVSTLPVQHPQNQPRPPPPIHQPYAGGLQREPDNPCRVGEPGAPQPLYQPYQPLDRRPHENDPYRVGEAEALQPTYYQPYQPLYHQPQEYIPYQVGEAWAPRPVYQPYQPLHRRPHENNPYRAGEAGAPQPTYQPYRPLSPQPYENNPYRVGEAGVQQPAYQALQSPYPQLHQHNPDRARPPPPHMHVHNPSQARAPPPGLQSPTMHHLPQPAPAFYPTHRDRSAARAGQQHAADRAPMQPQHPANTPLQSQLQKPRRLHMARTQQAAAGTAAAVRAGWQQTASAPPEGQRQENRVARNRVSRRRRVAGFFKRVFQ